MCWLPGLLWRLDANYKALRMEVPWLKRLPSEYVRDHVRLTTQPLERPASTRDLRAAIEMIGPELLLFATDYPHWDFDNPLFMPFKDDWAERIFDANAREWYGLPSRADEPAAAAVTRLSPGRERVRVCGAGELPPGERRIATVEGVEVGVFNLGDRLVAYRNHCPHQGAPVCSGRVGRHDASVGARRVRLRTPRPGPPLPVARMAVRPRDRRSAVRPPRSPGAGRRRADGRLDRVSIGKGGPDVRYAEGVKVEKNVLIPMRDGDPPRGRPLPARAAIAGRAAARSSWSTSRTARTRSLRGTTLLRVSLPRTATSSRASTSAARAAPRASTTDEYVLQEQLDGYDAIEWLAGQPFCDGHVNQMGISYGGFTSLQVATHQPPHLTSIIPMYFTDDRYTDDCHYRGGLLRKYYDVGHYGNFMIAYNALPPYPEWAGGDWARDLGGAHRPQRALRCSSGSSTRPTGRTGGTARCATSPTGSRAPCS